MTNEEKRIVAAALLCDQFITINRATFVEQMLIAED